MFRRIAFDTEVLFQVFGILRRNSIRSQLPEPREQDRTDEQQIQEISSSLQKVRNK